MGLILLKMAEWQPCWISVIIRILYDIISAIIYCMLLIFIAHLMAGTFMSHIVHVHHMQYRGAIW